MSKIPLRKFYIFTVLSAVSIFVGCGKPSEEKLWNSLMQARNNQNTDSTILVCNTILKEYPAGKLAAPALYMLAESYRDKKEYQRAVELYKEFIQKYPDMNQTPVAMFLVGFIYNNNMDMPDSARVAYQAFVAKYPHHDLAASAEFELQTIGKSPSQVLQEQMASKSKPTKKKKVKP